MNDIFSKLDNLKSIEPSESWVVDTKKRVLSEAPVFGRKNVLENNIDKESSLGFNIQNLFQNLTFKKVAVPAFSLVFVLSIGVFTLGASKSSLPGEFLYSIKMINEDMALAIASDDKKATIEMEQVDKRREELGKISKNHSDPKQGEKVEMLLGEIETGMGSAGERLIEIKDIEVRTRVAKVINVKTDKCAEFLTEMKENLSDVVKNEVSEKLASTVESNKKLNFDSLTVMVGVTEDDKDEILEKINNEINQIESEVKVLEIEFVLSDYQTVLLNEAKEEIEKAKQSLEDNNLLDAVENVAVVQKIVVELKNSIEEDTKKELLEDLEGLNSDDGDVLGVEDNIKDNDEDVVEEVTEEEVEEEVVE